MRALSERLDQSDKPPVTVNALTPGLCRTSLLRESSPMAQIIAGAIKLVVARSAEMGSRTLVHAAEAPSDSHGKYLRNCEITP
jgi:NAD(P)-dependent dehydrogenase (short-subunit alcohol dehydrogenase family)